MVARRGQQLVRWPLERVLVVHGEKLRPDGRLRRCFQARLQTALALARRMALDAIVISGGPTRAGLVSEAEAARHWLAERGLRPPAPLVLEEHARTTSENVRCVRELLGGRVPALLLVVSSRKRMPRVRLLWARLWPRAYRRARFVGAPDPDLPAVFWFQELLYAPLAVLDPRERTLGRLLRRWFRNASETREETAPRARRGRHRAAARPRLTR
ncbi:MAG: hypothetical protein KatS3mg102_2239 [Planctomycetota bacterium]|nr:MAG: hypothetical protein KatS3mg102_2239 [Planctomycetota bacterium]